MFLRSIPRRVADVFYRHGGHTCQSIRTTWRKGGQKRGSFLGLPREGDIVYYSLGTKPVVASSSPHNTLSAESAPTCPNKTSENSTASSDDQEESNTEDIDDDDDTKGIFPFSHLLPHCPTAILPDFFFLDTPSHDHPSSSPNNDAQADGSSNPYMSSGDTVHTPDMSLEDKDATRGEDTVTWEYVVQDRTPSFTPMADDDSVFPDSSTASLEERDVEDEMSAKSMWPCPVMMSSGEASFGDAATTSQQTWHSSLPPLPPMPAVPLDVTSMPKEVPPIISPRPQRANSFAGLTRPQVPCKIRPPSHTRMSMSDIADSASSFSSGTSLWGKERSQSLHDRDDMTEEPETP